jgi:hypothetical protein
MMMTLVLLILALFVPVSTNSAQPAPVECPLPPYQLPLQAPERSFFDPEGNLMVSGVDAAVELPDGLTVRHHLWSDDGEVMLVSATSPEFDSLVFAYRDGELNEVLGADDLLALRDEEFRDGATLYNPAFVPGTHIVLFNTEILSDAEGIYVEVPLDLWSLDLDSGELTEILPYGEAGQFEIAPDGQSVVLLGNGFIRQIGIDGSNPRDLFEGTVAIGLGHGLGYPDFAWDNDAELPTFRVLLFPSYDPNSSGLYVPFEVHEFVLGETPESRVIVEGPSVFVPAAWLSPDGYRVAYWAWQDNTVADVFDVVVVSSDAEPLLLASVEVPGGGITPFVRWSDETHLVYGYTDANNDNWVTSWMADLCGEITALEPYQAYVPSMQ